jgi:hypothetical protein
MICHARIILQRTIHLSKRLVISSNPIGGIDCVANEINGDERERIKVFKNHMSRDFEVTLFCWLDG